MASHPDDPSTPRRGTLVPFPTRPRRPLAIGGPGDDDENRDRLVALGLLLAAAAGAACGGRRRSRTPR